METEFYEFFLDLFQCDTSANTQDETLPPCQTTSDLKFLPTFAYLFYIWSLQEMNMINSRTLEFEHKHYSLKHHVRSLRT